MYIPRTFNLYIVKYGEMIVGLLINNLIFSFLGKALHVFNVCRLIVTNNIQVAYL
jgi:hypothetical protein